MMVPRLFLVRSGISNVINNGYAVCVECKMNLLDVVECARCHTRQPPPNHHLSYFSLLRPHHPPTLQVDQTALKQCYHDLMRRCHPDRAKTACDKVNGEAWSAWINKAYHCLREPFCRARHAYQVQCCHADCSSIEGGEEEIDNHNNNNNNNGMSMEELMQVLELRETVESATDPLIVHNVNDENEARIESEWHVLGKALERRDCASAKHLLGRLRYWETLREACEERLAALKR